jgi:hypothetical protein
MQTNGVAINDNHGLEKEADVMGRRALQMPRAYEVVSGNRKETKTTEKEVSQGDTVQMAGHAGVMIFSSDKKKLIKRVEQNEANQFQRIKEEQNNDDIDIKKAALSAFPRIYRATYSDNLITPMSLIKGNYDIEKSEVKEWVAKHTRSDRYVEMESFGGEGIDILDFKIGKATANCNELKQNYKRSDKSAAKKVAKMGSVDRNSETEKFGLRDSDHLKNNKTDAILRWGGKFRATLTAVDARLQKDKKKFGNNPYPDDAQVFKDLDNIYNYLDKSNTVYIASSLIVKWNTEREKRSEDRVTLIDLAHPIQKGIEDFDDVKSGMLLGILNLYAMFKWEKRAESLDELKVRLNEKWRKNKVENVE